MKRFDIYGEIWQMSEYLIARKEKTGGTDYPRQDLGELAVRMPARGTFQRSRELQLFSGFRILNNFWPRTEKLSAIDPEKEPVHIDLLRVRGDFDRPENQELGISYEEFAENYFNTAIDYALAHPGKVMLCVIGEVDSCCRWPDHFFRSREEAYEFFKSSCFNYTGLYSDVGRFFEILKKRNLTLRDINAMIHGACRFAIPYYFEWEYPNVEIERGLGTSLNMQISMGVLRGAWKQFGRKSRWGVDYSTHEAHFNQCTWYNTKGTRIGGHSEDLTERHWMHAFMSGADYLLCEGSDYTHWVFQKDGSFELSELGRRAKRFADFTLRSGIDRGTPVIPAAVMIDYKNGYEQGMPRPYVWGNRIPFTAVDANIGGVYELFFPGHGCTNGTDQYLSPATGGATRKEFRKALERNEDMRHVEIGFFTPTPYGDALDTIWENAPAEFLNEYKVIITAGSVKLPEHIFDTFVSSGGTLATTIDKLDASAREKLGIVTLPALNCDWDYGRILMADGSGSSDGFRYSYTKVRLPEAGEVLAENEDHIPIICSVPYGKGKVLFCTIPLGQEISVPVILPVWGKVIGEEVKKQLPVDFDAQGILSVSVNCCDDGTLLLQLINPGSTPWQGELAFRGECSAAEELYPVSCSCRVEKSKLYAEVAPFAMKIIKVQINSNLQI